MPPAEPGSAERPDRDRPTRLILLPNGGRPLFPQAMAPFSVTDRPAARAAVEEHSAMIGLVQTRNPASDAVTALSEIHQVGLCAKVVRWMGAEDEDTDEETEAPAEDALSELHMALSGNAGDVNLVLRGGHRFVVDRILQVTPYIVAEVRYPEESLNLDDPQTKALAMALMTEVRRLVKRSPLFDRQQGMITPPVPLEEAGRLADMAVVLTSASRERMQEILSEFDVRVRLEKALVLVKEELELVGLQREIHSRIEEKVNKQQHEFFLKEQLKTIKRELGIAADPRTLEVNRFRDRLETLACPADVRGVITAELDKLELIEPASPEFNVGRNYLDWLTSLPWGVHDDEATDLKRARRVLDADHFGLEDVKERIVEYLAVHRLKPNGVRGTILCLTGPPGVGKTSIGRSIARALGRKFFRFSLGGMRDEAEIKGHRRTYVGAMPGKITQALKRVGTANPVILLDEIDKLSSSYHGDPSSALLEVLDPEQNSQFLDHYLDVPLDLSRVFFIATANVMDTIPRPLLDRMEVIRLPGYVEEEKLSIARKYLVPRQLDEHGLNKNQLRFSTPALRGLTRGWAREAGVRKLEQQIAKVCRKVATRLATDPDTFEPVNVAGAADLKPLLGEPRFRETGLTAKRLPGHVVGLAWTRMGGAVLEIEAIAIPGKKNGFKHTGQLGGVMVESTAIAHSYISSRVNDFGIDPEYFSNHQIHLHVPAGATPKDGPSAGVTMATALLSLATGASAASRLGMTGELTLTGRVLPVGGIREKIIAARRHGLKEIILPAENERDLKELPDYITRGIAFHPVAHFDQVVPIALPRLAG
ncbi:MAG: endopeptidase La [Nitrospirota bacterium]|nr:endopeptidase La [Nitrospirota bacterium]